MRGLAALFFGAARRGNGNGANATRFRYEKPRKLALPGQVPDQDRPAGREEPYQPARTEPLKRSATKALISGV